MAGYTHSVRPLPLVAVAFLVCTRRRLASASRAARRANPRQQGNHRRSGAMDANWRPTQGSNPAAVAAGVDPNAPAPAGGEWRAQLQPEARSRIINKIMETLKKHLPVSVPEELNELQKIAVRFEGKIYIAATCQSDYLRKISLKMLSMETKTQQAPGSAQVIPNQNNPGSAPGLPPQGSNQAESSAIPLMSQQQARQPNTSASVQPSSLTNIGQNLPGVSQTSTLQNAPVMPQNTMNNGLAQGASQDTYDVQTQMSERVSSIVL